MRKELLLTLTLFFSFAGKAEEQTPCERELQNYSCDQARNFAPRLYNMCCIQPGQEPLDENAINLNALPGMEGLEEIQRKIQEGEVSLEVGARIAAKYQLAKANIEWSLCKAKEEIPGKCGPKPNLDDFLNVEVKAKNTSPPISSSSRDCSIPEGASRARCGNINYVRERDDYSGIGEFDPWSYDHIVGSRRDGLGALEEFLDPNPEPAEDDSGVKDR